MMWREMRLAEEYRNRIIQQVKCQAWARIALKARPPVPGTAVRLYGPVMARIGDVLAAWGERLHQRYAQFARHRPHQTANHLNAELNRILSRSQ